MDAQGKAGLAMVLPAIILLGLFVLYPMGSALYLSFTSWDLTSAPVFIGIRNYLALLSDPDTGHALWMSLYYVLGVIFLTLPPALGLALLLDRKLRGRAIYQGIIFTPVVLSIVVVAMIWRAVYSPNDGLYQIATAPFGLTGIRWLNSSTLAMPALIVVSAWKNIGYYLVIFLAGLQSISPSVLEAARMDGATTRQTLLHVTLPLLKPYLLFALVISVIRTSQAFAAIFALTEGGPNDATNVLPFQIYKTAFQYSQMGYASALSIILLLVLVLLTIVQFQIARSVP